MKARIGDYVKFTVDGFEGYTWGRITNKVNSTRYNWNAFGSVWFVIKNRRGTFVLHHTNVKAIDKRRYIKKPKGRRKAR